MNNRREHNGTSGTQSVFVLGDDLHFQIWHFNSYEDFSLQRFYKDKDYGEIGTSLVHGDRIVKVETVLYYNMDIDEVSGDAKLHINNGTLQGYSTKFTIKA